MVCVWIEDDFLFSPTNIAKIKAESMQVARGPPTYAIVNLGLGDEVNVVHSRKIDFLLQKFSDFEILHPLDITLARAYLALTKRVFNRQDRIFVGKANSTQVCPTCVIQTVASVNALIHA